MTYGIVRSPIHHANGFATDLNYLLKTKVAVKCLYIHEQWTTVTFTLWRDASIELMAARHHSRYFIGNEANNAY